MHTVVANTALHYLYDANTLLVTDTINTDTEIVVHDSIFVGMVTKEKSCLHVLERAQTRFWFWYNAYQNGLMLQQFSESNEIRKMKIYQYYNTRVADVLTKVNGVYVKIRESNTNVLYTVGKVSFGEFEPHVDPLDLLNHEQKMKRYRESLKIVKAVTPLDNTAAIHEEAPQILTRRRKIVIAQGQGGNFIRLTEYIIPLLLIDSRNEMSPDVNNYPEDLSFVCFSDLEDDDDDTD